MTRSEFSARYPIQKRAEDVQRRISGGTYSRRSYHRVPRLRDTSSSLLRFAIITLIASSGLCIACSILTFLVMRTSPFYLR